MLRALLLAPEEEGRVIYLLLAALQYITRVEVAEVQRYMRALRYMDAAEVAPLELQQLVLLPEQAQGEMAALHLVIKGKMVLLIPAGVVVAL